MRKNLWRQLSRWLGRLHHKNHVKTKDSGGLKVLVSKKFGEFYRFVYSCKVRRWGEQILREINYLVRWKDLVSNFFNKNVDLTKKCWLFRKNHSTFPQCEVTKELFSRNIFRWGRNARFSTLCVSEDLVWLDNKRIRENNNFKSWKTSW